MIVGTMKERPQTRIKKFTSLTYTGLVVELEHLKIETRLTVGMFVDSEIVLSTSYGKTRVFINKTLSTETAYQQDLINRQV